MQHETLIALMAAALGLAFAFGAIAWWVRLSPLVGYVLAGLTVGIVAPGPTLHRAGADELIEIGLAMILFGVGLRFSLRQLTLVRAVAVPGALAQIGVGMLSGTSFAWAMGWSWTAGLAFGMSLSVSSTVVLTRALRRRRLLESERGRIANGWAMAENLVAIVALLIALGAAGRSGPWRTGLGPFGDTLAKFAILAVVLFVLAREVLPRLLQWAANTRSRELFRLAVLAGALVVAFAAAGIIGAPLALGAFLAGVALTESPLSHRAAEESIPLREAYAVPFFVAVGLLFEPSIVTRAPWALAGTVAIVLVGKPLVTYLALRAMGRPSGSAVTIAASLAQIGEFSVVMASLSVALDLLPELARDLVVAGVVSSVLFHPLAFRLADRWAHESDGEPAIVEPEGPDAELRPTTAIGHTVLIGYGRVGADVGSGLRGAGESVVVIEDRSEPADAARRDGCEVMIGDATDGAVLTAANLAEARRLFVAIPDGLEAGKIVKRARAARPDLEIVARAHSDAEVEHLKVCGATRVIMGEREIARAMLDTVY